MREKRFLLTIKYDGTNYHGWQVQRNAITVQETLQDALEGVFGVRLPVTGCSRTDSGVHADQFCCHFDTDSSLSEGVMIKAINAHLPRDIAAIDIVEVPGSFHARYSANGKTYRYLILNDLHRNPFYEGYAWHIMKPIDMELLKMSFQPFIGTHDFKGFQSAGSSVTDTVRTITGFTSVKKGHMVEIDITADGFLYNMVRIIVGTLIAVQNGKILLSDLSRVIASKERQRAGVTAPPYALYLKQVIYNLNQ